MIVRTLATLDELARAAAEDFVLLAQRCVADHGRFTVALTGGTTPRQTYQMIATDEYASRVDWLHVHVFWGDERCVPPTAEASNFRMAREALLDHVPLPPQNVHRIRGEAEPVAAASAYEQLVHEIVGENFDLIHLGMGTDAHIASLFPGSRALHEKTRGVCAQHLNDVGMWRITLTPVVINGAANITFIVAGAHKADAVARVLQGPYDPDSTPAQIVAPEKGRIVWIIDAEAARLLR